MAAPATLQVFNILRAQDGSPIGGATVYCSFSFNAATVTATGDAFTPQQQSTTTDGNGRYAFTVVGNDLLSPANTVYDIKEPTRAYQIAPQSTNGATQQTTNVNVIVNNPVALGPNVSNVTGTLTVAGVLTAQAEFDANTNAVFHGPDPWFDVKHPTFGAVGNGVADDTTAVQAAIAAAGLTGGQVWFPPGTYLITGQLSMPVDGASPPNGAPSLRLFGSGSYIDGVWTGAAAGPSILDLRYSASQAKIDTRGRGVLEIDHLTLKSGGTDDLLFIHTTNTTLRIHDNAFFGHSTNSGTTCVQDAIALGGTSTAIDGTANAAFQGYGTVIKDNYFFKIRRGVVGQTFCNNVAIKTNTFSTTCGNSGGGAIELHGLVSSNDVGNTISENTIEVVNYQYGVTADYAANNTLGPNGFYDPTGTNLGCYWFGGGATGATAGAAQYNLVLDGYRNDTKALVVEAANSLNSNSSWTAHQSQSSFWRQPVTVGNTFAATLEATAPDWAATGVANLANAAGSRTIGRWTTSGPPTGLTAAVGDWGWDGLGNQWYCTAAGTPGTWKPRGVHVLDTNTAASGSFAFANPISSSYDSVAIEWYARSTAAVANDSFFIRFNTIATGVYDDYYFQWASATTVSAVEHFNATGITAGIYPGANASALHFGSGEVKIKNIQGATGDKIVNWESWHSEADTTGNQKAYKGGGKWRTQATAITRIDIIPVSNNMATGSWFRLLGNPT